MKRIQALLSALLLCFSLTLNAQSVVDSLRIDVLLQEDGSAMVTELWQIDVRGSITEWYLVKDNLSKMDITDLSVTDETGLRFTNEGTSWDVDRSRTQKAGRCGMVRKSNGYEVCWGVGSNGLHRFTVTYRLTGLVRAYSDADGFNYMFVSKGMSSAPENIMLRIRKHGTILTSDNVQIWGFGFNGNIDMLEGAIESWTTEPFTSRSSMIVMAAFQKGIFNPSVSFDKSFDTVKEEAFNGSDYSDGSSAGSKLENFLVKLMMVLFNGFIALLAFFGIRTSVRTSKHKKELLGGSMKEVPWYRDVPVGGDLRRAFGIMKVYGTKDASNLTAAYITRLFYNGAFEIVPQSIGKPALKIKDYVAKGDGTSSVAADIRLENELFSFFREASGSDLILQQKELKRWAARHGERLYNWQQEAFLNTPSVWSLKAEDVQAVYGLKRYLEDFTLIEDHGVVEVGLWNNYLIFASLYGIAKQVYKDFKKVCPEYFTMSQTVAQLESATPYVIWDTIDVTSRHFNTAAMNYSSGGSSSTRWSGGGGSTSFGGGGGFSGGGFGGGGR